MRLAVLGPVMLEGTSGVVPITPRKARELLTLLALEHPRPLSIDALAERMWNEPPPAAVKTIQGHLSRLRTALADAGCDRPGITGGPAGYRLEFDGELDVAEFNRLVSSGRQGLHGRNWVIALDPLTRARALVRGPLELPATAAGDAQRAWFDELVAGVDEDRLEVAIQAGHFDTAIADLEVRTAAHPLRERLWELRMIALARAGRSAEALRTFVDARTVLADEVGIEPGAGLHRIEREILDGVTPAPSAPPARATTSTSTPSPADAVTVRADAHYVEVDNIHVAYCTIGDGDYDIVHLFPGTLPVDAILDEPRLAATMQRQSEYARVTWLNRRGVGLSERCPPDNLPTIEDWMRDITAVLDDLRATSVVLFTSEDGNEPCLRLAAADPSRIAGVVITNLRPRFTRSDDYSFGFDPVFGAQGAAEVSSPNAGGGFDLLSMIAASVADDDEFRRWWDDAGRRGASPQVAHALRVRFQESDLRPVLREVTAPILLLSNPTIPTYEPGHEQWALANVANVESHHVPNPDELFWLDDTGTLDAHVERFVRQHARPRR